MIKIKPVQKIALAAMLLVLAILGTRLPALISIPSFEFLRFSLGPAFIIFSGVLLGPIYGFFIGGLSDLLGTILFPTTLGSIGVINPFITLMYAFMGLLAWLVFFLIKKIEKTMILTIILFVIMAGMYAFLLTYLLMNNSITSFGGRVYELNNVVKIILISLASVLSIGFVASYILLNKHFAKKYEGIDVEIDFRKFSFIAFVCEIIVSLLIGSLVKSLMYQVDFLVIMFIQAVMFFIDIIINSYITSLLFLLYVSLGKKQKGAK